MIDRSNGLPAQLRPIDSEVIRLSDRVVSIGKAMPTFALWTGPPVASYGGKALLEGAGSPTFAELLILDLLRQHGWDGVWVDSFRRKFWCGLPSASDPVELPLE